MSDFERALAVAAAAYDGLIDENGEPLIAGLLTQAMRAKTWRTRTLELLRWAIIDAGVTRAQLEAVGIDGDILNVLFPSHLPATYAVKPELMGDPVDVQLIIGATKPALLLRAASFAAHKHRDQRRKDARASPYINHPLVRADSSPPADWSLDRKRDYFDWAARVIDQLRGVHPQLEAAFDAAYECRP